MAENNQKVNLYLFDNKFLVGLKDNTIPVNKFVKSQECFVNCVNYWSQILGKLIFKLDNYKERKVIVENLMDEHGLTSDMLSHVETFTLFIEKLGGNINTFNDIPSINFNTMLDFISNEKLAVFIAALGFIEYYYQQISKIIVYYLKINNIYINIHYTEHEIIDSKHANDLFKLLDKYDINEKEYALSYGSELAIKIFDDYYNMVYDMYCI